MNWFLAIFGLLLALALAPLILPDPSYPTDVEELPKSVRKWYERGEYFKVSGYKIFYVHEQYQGNEENPPTFVILHGFPSSSYEYHKVGDVMVELVLCTVAFLLFSPVFYLAKRTGYLPMKIIMLQDFLCYLANRPLNLGNRCFVLRSLNNYTDEKCNLDFWLLLMDYVRSNKMRMTGIDFDVSGFFTILKHWLQSTCKVQPDKNNKIKKKTIAIPQYVEAASLVACLFEYLPIIILNI